MLTITILYPRADDVTFDMDYYNATHMPMLAAALGDDCHGWGSATVAHGKYVAMGWAMATDQAAFDKAMGEHGAATMGDVANYTNAGPEMIIGEAVGSSE